MTDKQDEFPEVYDSDQDRDYREQSNSESSAKETKTELAKLPSVSEQKGKKRVRHPQHQKREILKSKRNSGQEYVSRNVIHKPKQLEEYEHKCRYACKNVSYEERMSIFKQFWGLCNWNLQTAFISSCVECTEPKRKSVGAQCNKSKSIIIRLMGHRVCKMFFLKTLDISNGRYSRVVKKKTDTGFATTDTRGKAPCPNKITEDSLNLVKTHIDSFPKCRSPCTRRDNPNKKYLPSHLTVKKMYKFYLDYCIEKNQVPVKEWCYRHVFNTEFNLSFHQPLSETCNKCDQPKIPLLACQTEQQKSEIEIQLNLHHLKAPKQNEQKKS